jgi:hypothetical protein
MPRMSLAQLAMSVLRDAVPRSAMSAGLAHLIADLPTAWQLLAFKALVLKSRNVILAAFLDMELLGVCVSISSDKLSSVLKALP